MIKEVKQVHCFLSGGQTGIPVKFPAAEGIMIETCEKYRMVYPQPCKECLLHKKGPVQRFIKKDKEHDLVMSCVRDINRQNGIQVSPSHRSSPLSQK